jgi:energy-coupling factor transport system permease protein
VEEGNPLFSLDPRTKLVLGGTAIALVLFTRRPEVHATEAGLLLLSVWGLGMIRLWMRSLRLMMPMIGLVFAISFISFDLETALLLSLRLFNLLTVSFVFFRSLTPEELGDGLRKLGLPYSFSFILTTSMRYVPLIGRRARLIMEAQICRGIDLRPRIRNIPHFMALLMPLLVQSFLLSEELAMAMEGRGFSLKGRSFRKAYRIAPVEYILMILALAFFVAFLRWERG